MTLIQSESPIPANFLLINVLHCINSCIWDSQVKIFDSLYSHGNSIENQGSAPVVPKTHWMLCQLTFYFWCLLLSEKHSATILSQHIPFISHKFLKLKSNKRKYHEWND